jgi:hypothetical protein
MPENPWPVSEDFYQKKLGSLSPPLMGLLLDHFIQSNELIVQSLKGQNAPQGKRKRPHPSTRPQGKPSLPLNTGG